MTFSDLSVQKGIFHKTPDFQWLYSTLCVEWLLTNFAESPFWKTVQSNFRPPTRHKQWTSQEYQWVTTVGKTLRLKIQQCSISNCFQYLLIWHYLLGHKCLLIVVMLVSRVYPQPGGGSDFRSWSAVSTAKTNWGVLSAVAAKQLCVSEIGL